MANRSYLYASDKDHQKLIDLSEANYSIPNEYLILLSVDTKQSMSRIWEYKDPIAITGNYESGLKRLYDFFDYLLTQNFSAKDELREKFEETKKYFSNPKKKSDLFFLECGEIYEMGDTDFGGQNQDLFDQIVSVGKDVEAILSSRPPDLFSFSNAHWVQELKESGLKNFSLYWADYLYFSFTASEGES